MQIRSLPKLTTFTVLLVLAGCAPKTVVQNFKDQPAISTTEQHAAEGAYAVLPKAQDNGHQDWWDTLGDDELSRLEQLALQSSFDVKESLARLRQSQAMAGISASEKYPEIGLNASYTRRALSEHSPYVQLGAPTKPSNTWAVMGALNWELDLWGHLDAEIESANAKVALSKAQLDGIRLSLSADVADAYFGLCALHRQQEIINELLSLSDQYVQLIQTRIDQGVSTQNAIYQAKAEHASRLAEQVRIEKAISHAKNRIALLVGVAPSELSLTASPNALNAFSLHLPDSVLSTLVKQRPDVQAAEASLKAALAGVDVAKSDFYPRVALTGEAGLTNGLLSALDNRDSRQYQIGPALYLPIFNAGRLRKALTIANEKHEEAGQRYLSTVFTAWVEVNERLSDLKQDGAFEAALSSANQHARQDLTHTQNALQQGTASRLDLIGAHMRQLPYESALVNAKLQKVSGLVGLYRAIGGGWTQETDSQVAGVAHD
jgi:NodT family efflux transporter outer membrane factor (OMF) lipoprotein